MRFRFGEFELVPGTRELLAGGASRPVEPQVFDLIHFLIRERGRVVSRDDLVEGIWGGRIVSDSAISARVSAARTALDDSGADQRWIATVPRRGFRFAGEVEEVSGQPRGSAPANGGDRQRVAFCRSVDGTSIAYATSGSGYPVLRAGHWLTHLEHDWNSPLWRPMLDRLNRTFQVVRYDQRGNGLSDWDVDAFSLDRFVEDMEAVADAAGLQRFALYASSQGVPVAVAYAARHPERVSHLVLHGGYEQGRLVREGVSDREQAAAILTLIRHGWGKEGSALIDAFSAMFIPGGSEEQIRSLVELQRRTTSPGNAALIRDAVDRFDVSREAAEVRVPTLILHARNDAIQPLEQGRRLAASIPGAEFLLLESRNHVILPQEGAWEMVFEAIERFVSGG